METNNRPLHTAANLCTRVVQLLLDPSENSVCIAISQLESLLLSQTLGEELPGTAVTLIEAAIQKLIQGTYKSNVGRPKKIIPMEQLEFLLSIRIKAAEIAKIYGISRSTLFDRMKEYNLSVSATYTQISDDDLNAEIIGVLNQFPNTGYKRMKGYLRAKNIHVTDYRVRLSMREVDPDGVYQRTLRRNRTIRRRTYFVKYSNELWHIDGNLKLIRWGIVIRCAIDGKSRLVTYISASNNNRADSHLDIFLKGVQKYGIPLRTRSDKGGENVLIAKYMIENRGSNRRSHICGRSVHNQRIERFWRDLREGCTSIYYNLFSELEENQILDVDNPYHIWLLHHIFIPRLNSDLETFTEAWNNHPLSSESNRTPVQLMLLNLPPEEYDLIPRNEDLEEIDFACNDFMDLGRFDQINNPELNRHVEIDEQEVQRLLSGIDIHGASDSFGYDIFVNSINLLRMVP